MKKMDWVTGREDSAMPVLLRDGEMQLNAEVNRLRRELDDLKALVAHLLEHVERRGIAEQAAHNGELSHYDN